MKMNVEVKIVWLLGLSTCLGTREAAENNINNNFYETIEILQFDDVAEEFSEMAGVLQTAQPEFATAPRKCPCSNSSWCERIVTKPAVEVFVFSLNKNNWRRYDWSRITTIVEFTYHDDELMCYAHSRGVRVVAAAPLINSRGTLSPKRRAEWVNSTVSRVLYNFLDGVNVDHEAWFPSTAKAYRAGVTAMMQELNRSMEAVLPGVQVTMDIPRSLNGYDIRTIADTLDFFFIMSYHKPRGVYAGATAPYDGTTKGIQGYLDLGVPSHKLLLGVPWYGFLFHCLSFNQSTEKCRKYHVRPTNQNYDTVVSSLLPQSFSGRLWDKQARSPYGDLKNKTSGVISQFWYDDVTSLSVRTQLASMTALRGVGMWHADTLDYGNVTQVKDIWGTLPARGGGKS